MISVSVRQGDPQADEQVTPPGREMQIDFLLNYFPRPKKSAPDFLIHKQERQPVGHHQPLGGSRHPASGQLHQSRFLQLG